MNVQAFLVAQFEAIRAAAEAALLLLGEIQPAPEPEAAPAAAPEPEPAPAPEGCRHEVRVDLSGFGPVRMEMCRACQRVFTSTSNGEEGRHG